MILTPEYKGVLDVDINPPDKKDVRAFNIST